MVILRAYFNTRKAVKVTVRCVATHLESLSCSKGRSRRSAQGTPSVTPTHNLQQQGQVQTAPGGYKATHGGLHGKRPVSLCWGDSALPPATGEAGSRRRGLSSRNLTESQGEAAEPQAWHLGGLRRWVKGTASRQISWQEHTSLLQESHLGTPVPP